LKMSHKNAPLPMTFSFARNQFYRVLPEFQVFLHISTT
jgi:hypothetical protein